MAGLPQVQCALSCPLALGRAMGQGGDMHRALVLCLALAACAAPPPQDSFRRDGAPIGSAALFEVARFAGDWEVVAEYPGPEAACQRTRAGPVLGRRRPRHLDPLGRRRLPHGGDRHPGRLLRAGPEPGRADPGRPLRRRARTAGLQRLRHHAPDPPVGRAGPRLTGHRPCGAPAADRTPEDEYFRQPDAAGCAPSSSGWSKYSSFGAGIAALRDDGPRCARKAGFGPS